MQKQNLISPLVLARSIRPITLSEDSAPVNIRLTDLLAKI